MYSTLATAQLAHGNLGKARKQDLIYLVEQITGFKPDSRECTVRELREEIDEQIFTARSKLYREAGEPEDEEAFFASIGI